MNNLVVLTLSFFLGIALGTILDWHIFHAVFFVLLSLFFATLLFLIKRKNIFILSIVFLSISIGLFRVSLEARPPMNFVYDKTFFEGVIVSNPEERERSLRFVIKTDSNQKVLIYSDKFLDFSYGDRLLIGGEIERPENFSGFGGRVFDYENYLAKDNIYFQSFYPKIQKIGEGEGNFLKRNLFNLKNKLTLNIKKRLPNPESLLLSGLLFGERSSFSDSLERNFQKTGLIHIVVLSGYNVSIVADSIMKTLSIASFPMAASFGGFAIMLFAIMTGFGAATVRASIMALLVILARLTGRRYDVIRALFLAGFIMVLLNPKILLFDPGFQLSFMATLGLLIFSPLLSEKINFLKKGGFFKEIISTTLSAQLFVLPILLYQIGEISLIAPISNLIILPLIPLTMLLGFFSSLPLLSMFSFPTTLLLKVEIGVVNFLGSIPLSSIIIPKLPFVIIPIFYGLIFYFIWKLT